MIGVVSVEIQAKYPNMPLEHMAAYVSSPSSIRVRNVPKRIGKWAIESVQFVAAYPDGSIKTAQCVLTGCVWVGTIEGTQTSGTSKNGYTIFASGTDENGNAVTGYVLGKGDITILEADGTLNPDAPSYYVHLLSAQADVPKEGDLYPTESGYMIWQNGQANQLGTPFEEITAYVDSAISSKADLSALELKQDQLSEAQLSAIDQDANALLTKYFVQGESQMHTFIASSTLSKSDFAAQGVYDTQTQTWTKNITAVQAGTNVTTLETNLFKDVTTLTYFEGTELQFGSSGAQAFGGCTGLQTLILPKIRLLPVNICRDCSALTRLTIPASVTSIGRNAFLNCANLSVHFEEKTLAEVQAMLNYPWGLTTSNITASKTATQEWVDGAISGKADISALEVKRDLSDISYPSQIEGEDYKIAKWTLVIEGQDEAINGTWDFDNFTTSTGGKTWNAQVPHPTLDIAGISTWDGTTFYVDITITRHDYEYYTDPQVFGSFSLSEIVDGQPTNITLTFTYRDGSNRHEFTATVTPTLRQTTFALQDSIDAELEKKADLSAIGNAMITLTQGGVTKGTFTTNQSANATIDLDAGGGGSSGYTVNFFLYRLDGMNYDGPTSIKINGQVLYTSTLIQQLFGATSGSHCQFAAANVTTFQVEKSANDNEISMNGQYCGFGEVTLTSDAIVQVTYDTCLSPDTLILMADGTTKMIADVKAGDMIMTPLGADAVTKVSHGEGKATDVWTFEDGTIIKTIGRHRFFNCELGEPMYLEAWKIGERALTPDGNKIALVSHVKEVKPSPHWTIFTAKYNLYYANGLLAGNRHSCGYSNL